MKNPFNPKFSSVKILLLSFMCFFSIALRAEGPPPPPGLPIPPEDSIPLDGGLAILAVGAAAFGIKKLRDSKTNGV